MYRAKHVTQSNGVDCRLAVGCVHLDHLTRGKVTCTPDEMRAHIPQGKRGRLDADDLRRAWEFGHGETLVIRNGKYWSKLLEDRGLGRFIELDLWYGYPHTVGIAPETSRGRWLVYDPLKGSWEWQDYAELRSAAGEWGRRILRMPPQPARATETPVTGPSGTGAHPTVHGGVGDENFGPIYYTTAVRK